ncbi:MAG: O-antigen ligase family protein [Ignavibacteriaceae bacterium]|nr:O-antigen ligase family protein [Ignavibacteriaceae bacterium]MCW8813156.1 O-antigen ligase family protein [Chlorobium sp.]MCW8996983.1 O-antigen ligase family protein [Psychromonas sp.]MCW8817139.1 O-antigen ligase family protein [Ignavibacteriaceae bacterium]MCW8823149.1 O-antigen ligase family protein [Ignavibacteriaceae bacterium]
MLPVILLITLCFIFGERFIIALILITLFTLVGELNESLRAVVQITDFILLGIIFLKRFGLNFKEYPHVPKSIRYLVLLYFSAMIISAVMSSYPFAGIGIIGRQAAFFIIVYIFYALIQDIAVIKNYINALMIVAVIYVIISLIAFFFEGYSLIDILSKNRTRISIVITNPEALTNFYIFSFPIAITFFLLKKQKFYRVISLLFLFFISLGIMLTMARSSILAILLSSSILFFMIKRKLFYRFLFVIICIGLLILFYPPLNEIVTLFFRIEEGMSARDYIWSMSLNIIRDHPVFGLGPGAYRYEVFNYFPYMFSDWWGKLMIYFYNVSGGVNFSHNYFLVLFTELGILGLVTAITLPIIFFRIGIKTIKKYRTEAKNTYYLIIALFAIGASIILRNFFNSIGILYIGGLTTDLPFWLVFSSLIYFYLIPIVGKSKPEKQIFQT